MRNLLAFATGLGLLATACTGGPGSLPDPPVLKVTSPARSTMQNRAGSILVTGQVTPGTDGSAIESVMVNHTAAAVGADGQFAVAIQIQPGATLIHTEALAKNGGKATDTRAIEAGELRAPGSNIDGAITAAISKEAFAKISATASTMIQQVNFQQMLAPLQPMVTVGGGPDCLYAQLFVENLTMSGATIQLAPVSGGLSFYAEVDGLDVPGHMKYAAACINGSNHVEVTASKVTVSGTLLVTPNGMDGFNVTLANKNVGLQGLHISASGVPGAVLNILPLDSAIQAIVPRVATMFMQPMLNKALGALAGPKSLMVAGKTIDFQVSPSSITFTSSEGDVSLDTSLLIEGAEGSPGFIYTDNGLPQLAPGNGLQLGLADDLANEMMAQFSAIGMINITQPAQGGTFDSMNLQPTLPPMISADPADGHMRVVLPDMSGTFQLAGKPVAHASLNASIDLQVTPTNNGYSVAVQLGTPTIYLDILDDIPNTTGMSPGDMQKSMQLCLSSQIDGLSALLGSIPLPQIAGLQMRNVSVDAQSGYVMVKATLE